MDYVKSLGALTLAHRFKRIMNRLIEDVDEVYQELGIPFKQRWTSTVHLLHEQAPLGVTSIAERLQLSHPAVIQITNGLLKAGLVRAAKDRHDGRRRLFYLTAKGKRLVPELASVWQELEKAQLELFRESGWDVMALLEKVENRMDKKSLHERLQAKRATKA